MKQIMLGALRLVGSALRAVFVGVIAVAMIAGGVAVANYALTQGSGTNFASVVISTVHYAAGLLCDATVGTTQCAAVTASNALKVDGSAVTQPVSGTVTANAGTNLNTSALATSANQATNGATTAHTCSTGGFSELGCLGQIDDDVKSSITSGTALIGNVGVVTPAGATVVQGSTTGTTAATSTTLAATASVTNYVCEISIRANATAAATGNATLSDGTKTFNFTQWTAPNASGVGVIEEIFNPCYPASAVNTAWTLTSAAPGTGGVVSVAIAGYQK